MIKIVNSNKVGAYALITISLIVLWLNSFIAPIDTVLNTSSGVFVWSSNFYQKFNANNPGFAFLGMISTAILALYVIRLTTEFSLLSKSSTLAGFILILFIASFPEAQYFSPSWLTSLSIVYALQMLYKAEGKKRMSVNVFNTAFTVSFVSMIYFKAVFLLPLGFIVCLLLRLINLKTIIALGIGLILPWLLVLTYILIVNGDVSLFIQNIYTNIQQLNSTNVELHKYQWIFVAFYSFILVLALFAFILNKSSHNLSARLHYNIFIISLIYCMVFMFVQGISPEYVSVIGIYASIIIANFIDGVRSKKWQNIILYSLILAVVASQIMVYYEPF